MFRKFQQAPLGASPGLLQYAPFSLQGDEHLPKIVLLSELAKMSCVFSLNSLGKRNSFSIILSSSETLDLRQSGRGHLISAYCVPVTVLSVSYSLHVFSNLTSTSALIGGIILFYKLKKQSYTVSTSRIRFNTKVFLIPLPH